ncbi:uncharacterized protein [Musca autumnalis]|uniref:uncharacterized protein n=1 Tax=Musca autumnalis TaxID=221902 RepID=UPI003CE94DD6
MTDSRKIDIDIEIYNGAESVYSTTYRFGGHENAQGTISPNDWFHFISSAKSNMKVIEEPNPMIKTQFVEVTASVGVQQS